MINNYVRLLLKAVFHPIRAIYKLIYILSGYYLTWKYVDAGSGEIKLFMSPFKIKIDKGVESRFVLNGVLRITPYFHGDEVVYISTGKGSTLTIDGDFSIGNGTQIILNANSRLYIGGKQTESGSGITEKTRIMVYKNLKIGRDLICAWSVFITDCDWHKIMNNQLNIDTTIGDHVWIAPNCSILKGSVIGDGCIISTGTTISQTEFPGQCLIGGNPARVLKDNVQWKRDIP